MELPSAAGELPATTDGLRRHTIRSACLMLGGLTVLTAALAVIGADEISDSGPANDISAVVVGLSLVPVLGGGAALATSLRMRRLLARHPWRIWPGAYHVLPIGNGQPVLSAAGPQGRVMSVVAWRWRWHALTTGPVWYAGDYDRGGIVVTADGGTTLLWARPVRFAQRRFRKIAARLSPEEPPPP